MNRSIAERTTGHSTRSSAVGSSSRARTRSSSARQPSVIWAKVLLEEGQDPGADTIPAEDIVAGTRHLDGFHGDSGFPQGRYQPPRMGNRHYRIAHPVNDQERGGLPINMTHG